MTEHARSGRLAELQDRFAALAAQIPDSPEKEALSVLHGMIHEVRRAGRPAATKQSDATLETVANLYREAPAMSGAAVSRPLEVGTTAPDFSLPDANGRQVSLSSLRGAPVVLVFYPLDWSPTCSDQLSLYQAELDELRRFGAQVVGISVDSLYSHGAWAAVRGLDIPLLADFHPKGEVARRYAVYREDDGFSERALYVIDAAGVIRYAHVSPQLDHIPDIYELYRVLGELSGTDVPVTTARPEPVAAGAAR